MSGLRFYIDKISNSIEDAVTGKSHDTEVIPVTVTDLKSVLKKNGWWFNWTVELKQAARQLYKLVMTENKIIQGLISIQSVTGIGFIGMPGRSEKQVKKDIKDMTLYIKAMKSGKPLPAFLKKKLVKAK